MSFNTLRMPTANGASRLFYSLLTIATISGFLSNPRALFAYQPDIICSSCDYLGDCTLYYSSCAGGETTWKVYITVDEYSGGTEVGGFPVESTCVPGKVCTLATAHTCQVPGINCPESDTLAYTIVAEYNTVPCTPPPRFTCEPILCWCYRRHGRCCVPYYYYVQPPVPAPCCAAAADPAWTMTIMKKTPAGVANQYIVPLTIDNTKGSSDANIHLRFGKFRTDPDPHGAADPQLTSVAESDSDATKRVFHRVKPKGTMTNGYTYVVDKGKTSTINDLVVDLGDVSDATTVFVDVTAVNTTDKTIRTQRSDDILHKN
jgi:hypothetical protein